MWNVQSLFCSFLLFCLVYFPFTYETQNKFYKYLIPVYVKTLAMFSPDRKIFIEFSPLCIGTKICQSLLHVRGRGGSVFDKQRKLIAINRFVLDLDIALKVMYPVGEIL